MTTEPPSPYRPADSVPQSPPTDVAAPDATPGHTPYGYPAAFSTGPGAPTPHRGKPGLAALVLGVASVVTAFIPIVNFLSFLLGTVGLICGIVGLRRAAPERRQAVWGTVLSGSSLALAVFMIVGYTVLYNAYTDGDVGTPYTNDSSSSDVATPPPVDVLALGTPVTLTDIAGEPAYEATLTASVLNANEQVRAVAGNIEPPSGMKWAMVTVDVTALSSVHVSPATDIAVGYVTSDEYAFTPLDLRAHAPTPAFEMLTALAEGESATGNVVIAVPDDNSIGGRWTLSFSSDDGVTEPFSFAVE